MDEQRFQKQASIFEQARAKHGSARDAFLDAACGSDVVLREQVCVLLRRHDQAGVLDDPIRPSDQPPERLPERIGHFEIQDCLGRGGMGVVYRARQDHPRRLVALKMMHAGLVSEELRRRFEFETSVLARLQHPGIAQIYEVGTSDDGGTPRPFFAMELVEGEPLDKYARRSGLPIDGRLRLFIAICEAVHHAHQKGVIHRDLKPANILVTSDGTPRILDFGVARASGPDVQMTMQTSPGQLIGTLSYMSPEQVGDAADRLDTRSDVYALGVMLYELLVGQLPYELGSGHIGSAVRAIEDSEPRSMTQINRALRGDVETIVTKALRKRPEERYQSASDLAADIRRYLEHQPIIARPATALYQFSRFARRHRGFVMGVVGIALALIVGAGAVAWQAAVARQEARTRREVAEYLREMLTSIDPAKTRGADLTVRAMLDDAASNLQERFENARMVRGELHGTIASTYHLLGAFEEAERHARAAVADFEQEVGPRGLPTLSAMAKLGSTLIELDRLEEAEQVLRTALSRTDKLTIVAETLLENLGVLMDELGREQEALELFAQVYERRRQRLGRTDVDTLRARNNVAAVLMALRRFKESLPHMEATLQQRRQFLGDNHPHTIQSMANLGALYANLERFDESLALVRESIERSERVLGPAHIDTMSRRKNLVRHQLRMGQFESAAETAGQMLAASEREFGPAHRSSLAALEIHVSAVALGGAFDRAEALALAWYEKLASTHGATHRRCGRVAHLLVNLYEEFGHTAEQAKWQALVEQSDYKPGMIDDSD